MNFPTGKVKALGLCSGGLDSILAGLVLRMQGIDVEWISFETPFFSSKKARKASKNTGIPLTVQNITPVYLEMLKNPNCGYGQHMNPCMDCHALMFRLAGEKMKAEGFQFLFSGEVLGQRPMSQTKSSLRYVEKNSGHDGYILRPLSARALPETIPEKEGFVDRERLFDISGRSRKPQMALAEKFGVTDYPSPAGGCLLTEAVFSRRLKDLFKQTPYPTEKELHLLRFGRHFRLNEQTRVIVGRTKIENEHIMKYYEPDRDLLVKVAKFPGPVVLAPGAGGKDMEIVPKIAGIALKYSKAPNEKHVDVKIISPGNHEEIPAKALRGDEIETLFI